MQNKMKKIFVLISLLAVLGFGILNYAEARVGVRGSYRSNGTYVQPHYRSDPDSSRWNNWSTKGNYNPYTGKKGYVSPFRW